MDDSVKPWLKKELVALLGFPEVDDILTYILTTFKTQEEVEPYLTELLGVPKARAQSIGNRLFGSTNTTNTTTANGARGGGSANRQHNKKQAPAQQAGPLVPKPTAANSRIKQAKIKKPSKLLHSLIINCLKCGKIEQNGARKCSFCANELRYDALDDDMMDPAAQAHMEQLVAFDASGAERTTVLDTEKELYDEVQGVGEDGRYRQPIVLNLDLENRSFEAVEAPKLVLAANKDLNKEARDLLEKIQIKMDKKQRNSGGGRSDSRTPAESSASSVVVEDELSALYV